MLRKVKDVQKAEGEAAHKLIREAEEAKEVASRVASGHRSPRGHHRLSPRALEPSSYPGGDAPCGAP